MKHTLIRISKFLRTRLNQSKILTRISFDQSLRRECLPVKDIILQSLKIRGKINNFSKEKKTLVNLNEVWSRWDPQLKKVKLLEQKKAKEGSPKRWYRIGWATRVKQREKGVLKEVLNWSRYWTAEVKTQIQNLKVKAGTPQIHIKNFLVMAHLYNTSK